MLTHARSTSCCRVLVGLAALCCIARGARGAEAIDLRLRPVKGQVQRIHATVTQKLAQTINGTDQSSTQTIGLGYTFTTENVAADGTATIKVSYDAVSYKQAGQLGSVEYDSANPPAQVPQSARSFAALAGQSFTMQITPTGRVTQIEGLDQMVDSILQKREIPEGPNKAMQEKAIRHQFSEEALKENMESMLAIYPERPVKPGEQWTRKASISKGLPMVMDNTFTLKEVGGDVATLDVKSKLTSNSEATPIDSGPRKLTYSLSGEQTGTMKVDRATGWMKSAEMQQKVSGEMTTDAGGGRVAKSPITIDTTVKLESK
jgi:hypothetical protein